MAQTMSIQPVAWASYVWHTIHDSVPVGWTDWSRENVQGLKPIDGYYRQQEDVLYVNKLAYLFEFPSDTVTFTDCEIECVINAGSSTLVTCEMQNGDNKEGNYLDSDIKSISSNPTIFKLDAAAVRGGKCVVIFSGGEYCSSISMEFSAASTPSQVYPVNTPTSGTITADGDKTFSVSVYNPTAYPPYSIAAATLYWRMGTSDAFTPAAMTPDNDTASATLTAGTITNGIFQWYAEATDNNGKTTRTEVYTLTVMAGAVSVTALRPVSTVQNAQSEIVFEWSYFSLDNSPQARAALQYSIDGETWIALPGVGGSATSYPAPPGALPGGTIFWRVKAWSESGDESPWSSAVSFVCLGAPVVLSVTGDGKPLLTVNWQVSNQVSYKLRLDGRELGPYYGPSVREYRFSEPLSESLHKVAVAAQNNYSLWSAWHEADVFVFGAYEEPLQLTAESGESVRLSWTGGVEVPVIVRQPPELQEAQLGDFSLVVQVLDDTLSGLDYEWQYRTSPAAAWQPAVPPFDYHEEHWEPQKNWLVVPVDETIDGYQFRCRVFTSAAEVWTDIATLGYSEDGIYDSGIRYNRIAPDFGYFLIYRDDAVIAKTFERIFYDRTVLGEHVYKVLQILQSSVAYTQALQTATAAVDCPVIGRVSGSDWIELRYSEDAVRPVKITRKRAAAYFTYAGARYPEVEVSEHESLEVSFDAFWLARDRSMARAFEDLVGETVVFKSPDGVVIVGVLEGYDKRAPKSYQSYEFRLQQSDDGGPADA